MPAASTWVWVTSTAAVSSSNSFSTSSTERVLAPGSISAKTGSAPAHRTMLTTSKIVYGDRITLRRFSLTRALSAR